MNMTGNILTSDFKAQPFWWEEAAPFTHRIELPPQVDVVIVGSGFCGLSAGLRCLELGQTVLVVDAGPIGGLASSRSGAMLSSGQKFLLNGASKSFSEEKVDAVSLLHAEAFDYVKGLAVDEKLDFDFQQCGRLFLASVPSDAARFDEHARVLRARAGVSARVLARSELHREIGSDFYFGGMVVEEFGGIHPSKFGRALANRFLAAGGLAASHVRVSNVARTRGRFDVRTARGTVSARHVLFATNGYTDGAFGYLKRRIAPAASYIIATEPLSAGLMARVMPNRRMYSDSKRNLWYFRPSPSGERILFGARPAAMPVPVEEAATTLHGFLCQVFPQLAATKISHCWTGNVAMTSSHLQQIGSVDGIYYAVGCNGSGAAIMPYVGRLAAERMLGVRATPTLFETSPFKAFPPYGDFPWFVPLAVAGYEMLDWMDRKRAGI
ncbi:FAD dependent oxidoreductase [Caballeronia pedi]|uniref:FAD dependent oxidoreductase n=1 Tax=Caballeronia pedi TaxID=1777141 RepID=A0A158DT31_9BURK|nr:FAD-binding oxidoreductase [Caballeronia pedi]SAK97316.1 FAD dependent oxidoreductase [Caballeronia pedi]